MNRHELFSHLMHLANTSDREVETQRRLLPRSALQIGVHGYENLIRQPRDGEISVVVSLYGDFSLHRLESALASLCQQADVTQIIVAEQVSDDEPRASNLADSLSAKHVVDRIVTPAQGPVQYNPGRVRNVGLLAATKEWVYLSDADIVYARPDFFSILKEASASVPDIVWMRPMSVHVPESAQPKRGADWGGWVRSLPAELPDPLPFFWPIGSSGGQPVTTYHRGKHYVAKVADFRCMESNREAWAGLEPLVWQARQHDGGIFCKRILLDLVAGYSEAFINWGGEDADLQWKLAQLFTPVSLHNFDGLFVYHLDHPSTWIDRISWDRNRLLMEKRTFTGVLSAILDDLLSGNGQYHRDLQTRWSWIVPINDA